MPEKSAVVVQDFAGVAKDAAAQKLPPSLFQEDQGGDRYKRGSWKRRAGMLHSSLAKFTSPVVSMLGFELPGGEYALIVSEGSNLHGFTGVTTG